MEDDSIEYLESSHSVRYVAMWRHVNRDAVANGSEAPTREPVYETIPFEEWAETECAHVGARSVRRAVGDRLGETPTGLAVGVTTREGSKVIEATLQTTLDRDGNVISEPSVEFEAVREVTPATVDATVVLEGREHSCTVPVEVVEITIQQV